MLVIGLQSVCACAGRPDGGGVLEPARLTEAQRLSLTAALETVAAALDTLLRCSYRLEDAEQRRSWSLLPVGEWGHLADTGRELRRRTLSIRILARWWYEII